MKTAEQLTTQEKRDIVNDIEDIFSYLEMVSDTIKEKKRFNIPLWFKEAKGRFEEIEKILSAEPENIEV